MIGIKILTESLFQVPFLRIPLKKIYVAGEKYKLGILIKNMSNTIFPAGGELLLQIVWPNKLMVWWKIRLDKDLASHETIKYVYGRTDVLDDAPALFWITGKDSIGNRIAFCDFSGTQLHPSPFKKDYIHIHTIIPKNEEALFSLWALLIAAVSLLLLLLKDFIFPLFEFLPFG